MIMGKNGKWMWLTSKAACMEDVIEKCPQSVIDKFVLVTSVDSGLVKLDEQRLNEGWRYVGEISHNPELACEHKLEGQFALSPRVLKTADLPRDICQGNTYDEWYMFHSPPKIQSLEVFVNWGGFCLSIGHTGRHEIEPHGFEGRFWSQLETVNPHVYVADNGLLLFVTADGHLYEQVMLAVQDVELEVQTACDTKSPESAS